MANVTTYSAFTDAQSQNDISRNVRQYRDLDLFFVRTALLSKTQPKLYKQLIVIYARLESSVLLC